MVKTLTIFILALLLNLSLASAIVVNADYVTIYPGEQGKVKIEIENNEDFDIEDVSFVLDLEDLPFTSVGSSEKDIDEIDEDDDDSISFTLRASSSIEPGDYNIPYTMKYVNAEDTDEGFKKEGSFGIRVSAKTDLDFSIEVKEGPIIGQEGRVSLEIINKGLGEIKSVSVQIMPEGFELLSKDKVFVGTIKGDDSDIASFDVIYKSENPILKAKVTYKDFENNDQVENIQLPFKVYTLEEALKLGLIQQNNTFIYIIIVIILIVVWIIWRRIRKRKKKKK